MYHYQKNTKSLEDKFKILKEINIPLLTEKFKIDFDVKNLDWVKKNIEDFLPVKFQKLDIHPYYNLLSEKNETGSFDFWEGEKICLSWQLEKFSILNIINVFTKMGFYSEMDRANHDCLEVEDLDMNEKDSWDKLVQLLNKHEIN